MVTRRRFLFCLNSQKDKPSVWSELATSTCPPARPPPKLPQKFLILSVFGVARGKEARVVTLQARFLPMGHRDDIWYGVKTLGILRRFSDSNDVDFWAVTNPFLASSRNITNCCALFQSMKSGTNSPHRCHKDK